MEQKKKQDHKFLWRIPVCDRRDSDRDSSGAEYEDAL